MIKSHLIAVLLAALAPFLVCHAQTVEGQAPKKNVVVLDQILTPEIGGLKQAVEIKTDDASRPVLLFLSGGPGSSMMNNGASFTAILKTRFTIVQWDQRDAGKTLKLNRSPTQPSVKQMEEDTYEVIQFLRRQLKQDKIYLVGSSWGNVLGFSIVRNHPELLHAYFASNPVISQLASEKNLLLVLKDHFKDDPVAREELSQVTIPFTRDMDMFFLRKWLFVKEGKKFALSEDFKNGFSQWTSTWSPVWNEVMLIDLPVTLKTVKCPIYFLVGKNDIQTSTRIATAYFETLKAPKKGLFSFDNSAHQIHQEEPEKFQQRIIEALDLVSAGH
jgi:pimeloyl-ACP methyl ester carboxylesterase